MTRKLVAHKDSTLWRNRGIGTKKEEKDPFTVSYASKIGPKPSCFPYSSYMQLAPYSTMKRGQNEDQVLPE